MERTVLLCAVAASTLLSLFLFVRHFKKDLSRSTRIIGVLLLLVPLVGPLLYWFLLNDLPPQNKALQNRGPRGDYTHAWISLKPGADKFIKEMSESLDKDDSK
jgi:hypothetical protein